MICKKCRKIIPDDSSFCLHCGQSTSLQHKINHKNKHKKRTNGEGSVVYIGNRRSRPYAVRLSEMIDGKRKYTYLGYYATKKEAEEALTEQSLLPVTSDARITFKELFKRWTATKAYTELSQSTKYNYDAAYNHYAQIHSRAFADLKTADFENCIYHASKIVKKVSVPLSASAKRHMKILAGLLTKYATKNDIIRKGYAEFIRLEKTDKKEQKIYTDVEIQTLFNNDTIPGVDIILILIYNGMRINELLNLTKFSVNLTENTITGGLKTDAGKDRTIPIHPKIRKYIENRYNNSTDYLFTRPGTDIKLTDRYFRDNMYRPALEALGIEYKDIHSTRHTHATLLKQAGADTEAIKQLLGHSSYAFTADKYTHVDIDFLRNAINLI